MSISKSFKRGFTLIELMIVIVILGILVGTILPRITGGQDRARDVAAKADLSSIAQALELYYTDNNAYPVPLASAASECLNNTTAATAGSVSANIAQYMKGGRLPTTTTVTLGCTGYLYQDLSKNGVAAQAYAVAADMINFNQANYDSPDAALLLTATNETYANIIAGLTTFSAESANGAARSVLVMHP